MVQGFAIGNYQITNLAIFRDRIWKVGSGDRDDLVFRLCVGKDGGDEEEVGHRRDGDEEGNGQQQQQYEVNLNS